MSCAAQWRLELHGSLMGWLGQCDGELPVSWGLFCVVCAGGPARRNLPSHDRLLNSVLTVLSAVSNKRENGHQWTNLGFGSQPHGFRSSDKCVVVKRTPLLGTSVRKPLRLSLQLFYKSKTLPKYFFLKKNQNKTEQKTQSPFCMWRWPRLCRRRLTRGDSTKHMDPVRGQ